MLRWRRTSKWLNFVADIGQSGLNGNIRMQANPNAAVVLGLFFILSKLESLTQLPTPNDEK